MPDESGLNRSARFNVNVATPLSRLGKTYGVAAAAAVLSMVIGNDLLA
jgi:hypothetical protein